MDYWKRIEGPNIASFKRQQEKYGYGHQVHHFQSTVMDKCFNLYSRKLYGHYGCVNAIEFASRHCDLFASGICLTHQKFCRILQTAVSKHFCCRIRLFLILYNYNFRRHIHFSELVG